MTDLVTAGAVCAHMRTLPFAPLQVLLQGQPTLVLAPHPDDESLGCGGLIAASCAAGLAPLVVVVTDGAGSHPSSRQFPPEARRQLREGEAAKATTLLGLPSDRLAFLRQPDTAAPTDGAAFDAAVIAIADMVVAHGCGSLCVPWIRDPHGDHEATNLMGVAAAARTERRLLTYPVWGWTLPDDMPLPGPFPEGVRFDITPYLAAKKQAIAAHASQHGTVITDDPGGFSLAPEMLRIFDAPYEVFLGDFR